MRTPKPTTLALTLAIAFPAIAAAQATDTKKDPTKVAQAGGKGGMNAEQEAELNRVVVKAEALEDSRDESGLKGFKVSGYADVAWVYNANKERGTFQFLVPNDQEPYGYDNSYFGTVSLDVQKETESGTRYRLTLIPKRGIGDFQGYASIVHEATVSIPLGGVNLFAGQIPDWQGYEYVQPTLNKLISHNLLFDFTLPYGYTGAGLEFGLGDLAMKAALVNVNTAIRPNGEVVPALVFRGDYEVSEFLGFGFAGLFGPKANLRAELDEVGNPVTGEPYDLENTVAATIEADFWYTRGDLTLNGHVAYGMQKEAAVTADPDTGELRDATWYGASALLGYKLTPRLEGILRGDYIFNSDNGGGLLDWNFADAVNGIGPDQLGGDPEKGADRYAVTVGLNYAMNANATFKLEYRYDGASQNVFGNKDALDGGPSPDYGKSNSLISTAVVVFF